MAASRSLEVEWLDELAADDPRAIRSRADLRRVNAWMRQAAIMRRLLAARFGGAPPRNLIELGGGDGTFMLRVARMLFAARRHAPAWRDVRLTLVDRQSIVNERTRDAFGALGWRVDIVQADVADFFDDPRPTAADGIVANLFLHHLAGPRLDRLFANAATLAPLFVACEPRRSPMALAGSRLLWAIGCNDVSRHDATASVRAGFRDGELSAHWPDRTGWRLTENAAGLFTHVFVAERLERLMP